MRRETQFFRLLRNKTYAVFDVSQKAQNLSALCFELVEHQKRTWPALRQGYELLKDLEIRDVACQGFSVRIQYNPGRTTSTLADTRKDTIKARPCFLCLANLPEEQKGILYNGYLILCNPAPVFSCHLTINSIRHIPQSIDNMIEFYLRLAEDLGSEWVALYNGPQCGASAPDHMHFQAIPRGNVPVAKDILDRKKMIFTGQVDNVSRYLSNNLGRMIILFESEDRDALAGVFNNFLRALRSVLNTEDEPMINCACFFEDKRWFILIFPRTKHRPEVFFREGDEKITVSPAVIEMAGVVVAPVKRDFLRIDALTVEAIYQEVSLDRKKLESALGCMS